MAPARYVATEPPKATGFADRWFGGQTGSGFGLMGFMMPQTQQPAAAPSALPVGQTAMDGRSAPSAMAFAPAMTMALPVFPADAAKRD